MTTTIEATTTATATTASLLNPHLLVLVALTSALGTLVTLVLAVWLSYHYGLWSPALLQAHDKRRRLPQTIILVRHGESEANVDHTMWQTIPDNLLGLTAKGRYQARQVGQRIERILQQQQNPKCSRVHLVISPFERTIQTASEMRKAFEHRIVRTDIESRIREQEVGNLQGAEFQTFRQEQQKVGRFWYRFPTGESGADVFDRVKSWWFESVLTVNMRTGYDKIDALVIVTHGLTMRFIMMQLFGWSPTTFHSIWNAGNCYMYVFQKDLSKPGASPYVMDKDNGDMPRSSIDVVVTLKKSGEKLKLKLEDYLSIPPPRTIRTKLVKHLLAEQYPLLIPSAKDISKIVFQPFIQGSEIRGRSISGVLSNRSSSSLGETDERENVDDQLSTKSSSANGNTTASCSDLNSSSNNDNNNNNNNRKSTPSSSSSTTTEGEERDQFDVNDDDCPVGSDGEDLQPSIHTAKREVSMRFPCVQIPGISPDDMD